MQQNAVHGNTEGFALMLKAAPKGGCEERCPLRSSTHFSILRWLGISLHWWKTEAHSPEELLLGVFWL